MDRRLDDDRLRACANGCHLPTMDLGRTTRDVTQATRDRMGATRDRAGATMRCAQVHTARTRETTCSARSHAARLLATMDRAQA